MRSADLLCLVTGLIVAGALAAPASAGTITVEEYSATPADGGGHAFWLPPLVPGDADRTMWFGPTDDDTATFTVTRDSMDPDNPTIMFVGSVVSSVDANLTFDFFFRFRGDTAFDTTGYDGKRELHSSQYVENGGTIDTDTWEYFDMVSGLFVGTGSMAGSQLSFFQEPTDGSKPFQLGVGANGKNTGMGFSGWLGWTVDSQPDDTDFHLYSSAGGHGDINIDLELDSTTTTEIIPEPSTMALFGLGLLGFGAVAARRRKRRVQTSEADATSDASAATV